MLARVPALQYRFGLNDTQLSGILLIVPVIAGAGSMLAGALIPRAGSALVLRIAQPVVCASIVGIGAARTIPVLLAAAAIFGLSIGTVDATMNAQAVTTEARYGRSLLTGFHAVWSAAGILGALWAAYSAHIGLPLVAGFGVAAAAGVALSAATGWRLFPASVEVSIEPGARTAAATAIPWRPILVIGAAVTCMYIGDSATSNWSAVYLNSGLRSSQSIAAFAYAAYQTAMVIGRGCGDLVVRRIGAVVAVRAGGVIALVGLAGVVTAPGPWFAIVAFGVAGLGLCVVVPQSFSAAGRLDPQGTGTAVARVNLFNYAGFVLGGAMIGPIATVSNLRVAFGVPLVLTLVIVATAGGFGVGSAPRPSTTPG